MASDPTPPPGRLTRGYPADLDYTAGFYPETAPSRLAFAALAAGADPGPAVQPTKVLELGFGQGFGLALLAAANPDVRFEGCDFNPAHVAHARGLADAAGLNNLEVSAAAFEDLASAPSASMDCDVIIAHGVMSWVSPATASAVVEVVRRRLRPGGLFHVSYNCAPGRVPDQPLRDLFRAVAARSDGTPADQAQAAVELIRTLREGGASYIVHNPVAAQQAETILNADPVYLAHEYLGEHWRIFSIAQMAALLEPADLTWLCSATPADDLPNLLAPPALLPLIASSAGDPIWRETLKDIACNRAFRRDVFVRGPATSPSTGLDDWRCVLTVPLEELSLTFLTAYGSYVDGGPAFYSPVINCLAGGPQKVGELKRLPIFAGRPELLLECLCLLAQSGQIGVAPPGTPLVGAAAQRFNAEVVARARAGRFHGALASPLTRSGVPVRELDLLTLAALAGGTAAAAEPIAQAVQELLSQTAQSTLDGVPVGPGAAGVLQLSQAVGHILDQRLPLWSRLGLVPV